MENSNKKEHDLAIKTVRNMRRRYATVVRRIERENKSLETWMHKSTPSFFDWMKRLIMDDTYSKRVGTPARQLRVKPLIAQIKEFPDRQVFYKELGNQLMKFTDEKEVRIYDDTNYSDDYPESPSIRIGVPKHHW